MADIPYIGSIFLVEKGKPTEIKEYLIVKESFTSGSKLISTTHDVSVIGDQAITGAGFKPSGGVIMATVDGTTAAAWGLFDSSLGIGSLLANRAGTADNFEPYTQMWLYLAAGEAKLIIKSLDADGLTITWSKGSSPTGTATIKLLLFR